MSADPYRAELNRLRGLFAQWAGRIEQTLADPEASRDDLLDLHEEIMRALKLEAAHAGDD